MSIFSLNEKQLYKKESSEYTDIDRTNIHSHCGCTDCNNYDTEAESDEQIKRIMYFEKIYDELHKSFKDDPKAFTESEEIQNKVDKLVKYYESPLWLSDFESDERGELPKELKRGVLSEDGVYLLLESITEYIKASGNI